MEIVKNPEDVNTQGKSQEDFRKMFGLWII